MMRFDFFKKRKEEPVKVLELFGGIGACTQAFKRVGIPFEVVDYVEIDKFACKSYNAMYGTDFKPQDICEWDKDIKVDFIMHGSPCQDFSVAGKGLGGDEGMCNKHYQMYRLHGDPLYSDKKERCTSNGYYRTGKSGQHEHRKVYEDYYGVKLRPEQIIHHINFIRTDNRISNLYCYNSASEHQRVHNAYRRLLKECSAEDIEFKDGMYHRKSV